MSLEDEAAFFQWPRIGSRALERVAGLLQAGATSWHPETLEAFERDVAALFGVRRALSCVNGTSACFSALKALGVGPGDTVIASAIGHWASVLPAVQCGARVALADVLPDTCHIDPEAVRRLLDGTVRAVVVTHMFGEALRLDELRALCDEHGLALVEDVSHAHGAAFGGRPVGSYGDVSFCSFQAAKLVSGGEGGALLTDRDDLYYRAMELGHPRRLLAAPPERRALAGVGRGFKLIPSPILVALAHESLKDLPEQAAVRKRACEHLRARLRERGCFANLDRPPAGRVYFRNELLLAAGASGALRDRLVDALQARGVRARRVAGYLADLPSLAGHLRPGGPWLTAEDVMRRVFFLDAFTAYEPELVDRYAGVILETLDRLREESRA